MLRWRAPNYGAESALESENSAMTIYRRAAGANQLWHFCRNCPHWPARGSEYAEQDLKVSPPETERCARCQLLVDKQDCSEQTP